MNGGGENLLDLSRQQRNLLLFRPLVQLELSKNLFGDGAEGNRFFDGIDTPYLVLSILDFMMEGTTVALGFTQQEVLERLAELAAAIDFRSVIQSGVALPTPLSSLAQGQAGRPLA